MAGAETEEEPYQKRDTFIDDVKSTISTRVSLVGIPSRGDRDRFLESLGRLVYDARSFPANGGVIVCINPAGFFVIGITLSQKPEGRYSQKGGALRLSSTQQIGLKAHRISYSSISERVNNNVLLLNEFLRSNKAYLIGRF